MTTGNALTDKPLSYSQLSTYLGCKYRWYLQYVLGIRPKTRSAPLEIGDAVHRGLASFLLGNATEDGIADWYKEAVASQPFEDEELSAKIEEYRVSARLIVERALDGLRTLGYWSYINKETGQPFVESSLFVPVPKWDAGLVAKIDWMAYDPLNKRVWVSDFKTRNYFTSEQDEWANLQNTIYLAAALYSDIESVGTLTIQITNTAPKLPKRTKDGGMSRAAVACDWLTYVSELEKAGLDPKDYEADMKPKLESREMVRVTPVIRSVASVERIWNEIVEPLAGSMSDDYRQAMTGDPALVPLQLVRNLSPRTCNYCGHRSLCHGILRGNDVSDDLTANYESKAHALPALRAQVGDF